MRDACVAAVTVNLDGEQFWLSRFPDSLHKPKTLSMGTYGLTRGLERVLDALDRRGIAATFFVPGIVAEQDPGRIRDIAGRGHEIASHGYAHENLALLSGEAQWAAIRRAQQALTEACGAAPVGFRAPEGEITQETMALLARAGLRYSSSLYNEDRVYRYSEALVEIPVKWQLFDFPYFAFNYSPAMPAGQGRIANYSAVLANWKYELDGARQYGLPYILQVDPQTIGTPGRIGLLEEILDDITAAAVPFALCRDLAGDLLAIE